MGGNIPGHIIPGTGFLIQAFYIILMYIAWTKYGKLTYLKFLQLGGFIQILAGIIGTIAEVYNGSLYNRPFQSKDHITMYLGFSFSGLIILAESKQIFPENIWKSSLALAQFSEGLLFYIHSQMQMMEEHHPIESLAHWLLSVNCFCCGLMFLISWLLPKHPGIVLIACGFVLHQALWFYFLAYSMYSGVYGDMAENLPMGDCTVFFIWLLLLSLGIVGWIERTFKITNLVLDDDHQPTRQGLATQVEYSKVDQQQHDC
jgi:hypothetical protein